MENSVYNCTALNELGVSLTDSASIEFENTSRYRKKDVKGS